MRIIEASNVDLIAPFPLAEVRRTYGWSHCYRTLTESDDGPQNQDEFSAYIESILPNCVSYGVIDKNKITNSKHEAPLVGIIIFEPATLRTGFFHVATARRSWRTGLIDEAGEVAIKDIFEGLPTLTRVGAFMFEKNFPARALCKRLGFELEGIMKDLVISGGELKNVAYYGLTRRKWECQQQPQYQQSQVSEEASSEQLEAEELSPQEQPLAA